ncbi:CRISPR-associated RAMP protein, Csm5 family [Staphylothermus marinus F1]|uniref:CRISPR system Cms protein Csm5 n=1 Tax=Staphylothermus marinus (strain ATCC 43588 / DSM 3639 / JCM 9404 / F1) TaxID=399550 RepID=A3DLB3_STAMF|nr:type III-A CRISPR-associated RAMP protein Csm5 [Staphylothermus marinus]ABN69423.1 CRISPR-associated RAMP protein, Csm5 family [Staphylothermus marinus F1]
MREKIIEKHRILLKVATETHVWSGDMFLQNVDLVVSRASWREFIAYILDMNKLTRIIIEKGKHMDLLNALKSRNILALLSKYKLYLKNVSSATYISKIEPKILGTFIKKNFSINNIPLIPGSELKGLIRTAILNYMITYKLIDPRAVDEALNNLSFSESTKNIDQIIQKFIRKIITASKTPLDLLKFVSISDPLNYNVKPIIDKYVALKLASLEEVASEDVVALDRDSFIEYEISIYKPVSKEYVRGQYNIKLYHEFLSLYGRLLRDDKELKLLKVLKDFSLKMINFEIKRLDSVKANIDKSFIKQLDKWRLEVSNKNNVFYFKTGYGTGMYSKTIFLSMNPDQQKRLIRIMTNIMANKTKDRISVWDLQTMKIVGSDFLYNKKIIPVGWVRLEII